MRDITRMPLGIGKYRKCSEGSCCKVEGKRERTPSNRPTTLCSRKSRRSDLMENEPNARTITHIFIAQKTFIELKEQSGGMKTPMHEKTEKIRENRLFILFRRTPVIKFKCESSSPLNRHILRHEGRV